MRLYGWYKKYEKQKDKRRRNFDTPQPNETLYEESIKAFEEKEGSLPNTIGIRLEDKRDWMTLNVKIMKPPPGHYYLWTETKKSNT